MPLLQRFLRAGQRKGDGFVILRRDPLQDTFPDLRIREYDLGEKYIFKIRIQIVGENKGHASVSVTEPAVRNGKRMHAPAPVPVQIGAVAIAFKKPCAHSRLADAGRPADEDQLLLHGIFSFTGCSRPALIICFR